MLLDRDQDDEDQWADCGPQEFETDSDRFVDCGPQVRYPDSDQWVDGGPQECEPDVCQLMSAGSVKYGSTVTRRDPRSMRRNQRRYKFKQVVQWLRTQDPVSRDGTHLPTPESGMEHDVFEPSGGVVPSTTSPGACIAPSPSESEPSSSRMANRRRSNNMAKKAFYDHLAASARDGQEEQVWTPSDVPDTAVALSALAPTSPSASLALTDQSSASMVVRQNDSSTVVAAAELTDAKPGIALCQQVSTLTVSVSVLPTSVVSPQPLSKNARKMQRRRANAALSDEN